jgi:hypothetical protein
VAIIWGIFIPYHFPIIANIGNFLNENGAAIIWGGKGGSALPPIRVGKRALSITKKLMGSKFKMFNVLVRNKMSTVLPSLRLTTDVWNMGKVQLIQLLMHIWGLYQALLQNNQCLEKKTPTKVIDFDGKTAPLTDVDKNAILEGRNSYLEIENRDLRARISKLQEKVDSQQHEISNLQKAVNFWKFLAQKTGIVARSLSSVCKEFMFDNISQENIIKDPVICVGEGSARAFVTERESAETIMRTTQRHPLVQNDRMLMREFPELKPLNSAAAISEQELDILQKIYERYCPKN